MTRGLNSSFLHVLQVFYFPVNLSALYPDNRTENTKEWGATAGVAHQAVVKVIAEARPVIFPHTKCLQ
jgi:hypothetical protein